MRQLSGLPWKHPARYHTVLHAPVMSDRQQDSLVQACSKAGQAAFPAGLCNLGPTCVVGGLSPVNFQSVMDSPERVRRVTPPSTTMLKTQPATSTTP